MVKIQFFKIILELISENYYLIQNQQSIEKEEQMSKGASYKFNQMFGYKGVNEKINEEDIINVMKFDQTGQFLALGDKAGRIIVFRTDTNTKKKGDSFDYYAQFQSHNKQFDCLSSHEVEQKINDICWLNNQSRYHKVLTTNAKSIKLWKIFEKTDKKVSKSGGNDLRIPSLQVVDKSFIANVQSTFPSKHQSDIHTLSRSANEEYLLSFDDVQGFFWNLERPDKPYAIVDYLKKMQVEDVKEHITCGIMHPTSDSIFAYGTDKKTLKIHDMRLSSQQTEGGIKFKNDKKVTKNFFTELIQSYSSVDFLKNGKYIAARDYLSVKVWDVCNTKKPLLDITLQQNYKTKLCDMFQNDYIFDKFRITSSGDGNSLLTGSYNNTFHMIDTTDGSNSQYELNYKKTTVMRNIPPQKSPSITKMDYQRKTAACDFNKKRNLLAVASLNCFFVYSM